jgi:twitching motility protein PilT
MLHELILDLANAYSPSDLHINEGRPVWLRVNGVYSPVDGPAISREQILDFLKRHEANTNIIASKLTTQMESKGDLDFQVRLGKKGFRGNIYYANGKKLAIQLRPQAEKIPKLETLGLPPTFVELLEQSKGLLLVTGATGSGKTTTLAAGLDYLNRTRDGHIITLEDPVEYVLKDDRCIVDQRQIGRDATNFTVGLRSALRQDPDILLVGELRDFDTVKTALDAANTGHLVLATLHTNSAQQTIERLTSFFSADKREWALATLSQALLGIVSQVLVPRADGNGRLLAAEMLVATPDVKTSIRDGRTAQIFNSMDTGSAKGHVLLNNVLADLVRKGVVHADDALYAAYDPARLKKEIR